MFEQKNLTSQRVMRKKLIQILVHMFLYIPGFALTIPHETSQGILKYFKKSNDLIITETRKTFKYHLLIISR